MNNTVLGFIKFEFQYYLRFGAWVLGFLIIIENLH
jgi:hypothetical protein